MSAKALLVAPIEASAANALMRRMHYSGKVVPNSQLHLGVYWQGRVEGVMQFGPSINKRGTINLVRGTAWNEFIELNRMAFSERLPRNSESRALGVAMRMLRKNYPHLKWVISFADAAQCGDGTIYRASGFSLVGIQKSGALRIDPRTGEVVHIIQAHHRMVSSKEFRSWQGVIGYQLKYIYFLKPECRAQLAVPVLDFAAIAAAGATMYRGKRNTTRAKQAMTGDQPGQRRCDTDPPAPFSGAA